MARRSRSNSPTAAIGEEAAPEETGALRRGLEVMRMISPATPIVTLNGIVDELNTTRATAQRLVSTLVEHRFLRLSKEPGQYYADVASLTVGRAFLSSMDGLESLAAMLRTFQEVEKVGVTVWVRERAEGVCVATSGSRDLLVGRRFELDRFSAGHALMWASDTAARITLLERFARAQASGDRASSKVGSLYGSFHQLETEGYCVTQATPEAPDSAIAFPFRGMVSIGILAFSIEQLQADGSAAVNAKRAKALVSTLTDLLSHTFSH